MVSKVQFVSRFLRFHAGHSVIADISSICLFFFLLQSKSYELNTDCDNWTVTQLSWLPQKDTVRTFTLSSSSPEITLLTFTQIHNNCLNPCLSVPFINSIYPVRSLFGAQKSVFVFDRLQTQNTPLCLTRLRQHDERVGHWEYLASVSRR